MGQNEYAQLLAKRVNEEKAKKTELKSTYIHIIRVHKLTTRRTKSFVEEGVMVTERNLDFSKKACIFRYRPEVVAASQSALKSIQADTDFFVPPPLVHLGYHNSGQHI